MPGRGCRLHLSVLRLVRRPPPLPTQRREETHHTRGDAAEEGELPKHNVPLSNRRLGLRAFDERERKHGQAHLGFADRGGERRSLG
jgi:hypothetical protein